MVFVLNNMQHGTHMDVCKMTLNNTYSYRGVWGPPEKFWLQRSQFVHSSAILGHCTPIPQPYPKMFSDLHWSRKWSWVCNQTQVWKFWSLKWSQRIFTGAGKKNVILRAIWENGIYDIENIARSHNDLKILGHRGPILGHFRSFCEILGFLGQKPNFRFF